MWYSQLKLQRRGEMTPAPSNPQHGFDEMARAPLPADLLRSMGYDATLRILEAATARASPPERWRDAYFQPGGYAMRDLEPWAKSSTDPNLQLGLWVCEQLARTGLPACLRPVVVRLALVTMRDGIATARTVLLEERSVPEQYHFAINGILKSIPPLI